MPRLTASPWDDPEQYAVRFIGSNMRFTDHRQKQINDLLLERQRVSVQDLMDQFEVSAESIRRDLRELEKRGVARRVYGGAVLSPDLGEIDFGERARMNSREKARIGAAAARLVEDGMKIFIGSGTTALMAAKCLDRHKDLKVVTNSIGAAASFFGRTGSKIRVLGGAMRTDYQSTYGSTTLIELKEHHFDVAILGASAVHLEHGFMNYEEEEVALHKVAHAHARRTVVVADSSKFGLIGSVRSFGIAEVDVVVTGGHVERQFVETFAENEQEFIQA